MLKEAEHRSTFYLPYWKLPLASVLVPRQRAFRRDLGVINECLDGLIAQAKRTRNVGDAEALQSRDYTKVLLSACSVWGRLSLASTQSVSMHQATPAHHHVA